jgi:hypothetical protein
LINDDTSRLFAPDPSRPAGVVLGQGIVQAWDPDTGENEVQFAGGTLVNIPSLMGEAANLAAGDVVAMAVSGDRMLVLGKVTTPGDPGTVPTWNADLTALAPLTELAAITTGTTIMGATNVTTDPGDGAHVVVNDPAYPGQIVLYSGNSNEVVPARIRPILSDGNFGALEFRSPSTSGPDAYAYMEMDGYEDGHTSITTGAEIYRIEADSITLQGDEVRIGADIGDRVTIVGNTVTDADLSSLTNTFPTFPYYYGYLNASQSIPHNTATKVTGWVADGTPNNSEITHSAGNFTIPRDGRYRLRAQGWWALNAGPAGFRTLQWIRVSPNTGLVSDTTPPSATSATPNFAEKTVRLAAGEQVFVQMVQTQGVAVNLVGSNPDITYAQIEWVGP